MAQVFADWGANVDLHYLDLSLASRAIAEGRMAARGLSASFHTADLLNAPELGLFDYIDCCGVLDHIDDPDAAAAALSKALAPGGGIGVMVNAPYGRAGIYEMQAALRALVGKDSPEQQVALSKGLLENLPPTNAIARNPFVVEYLSGGDAGLYDLLLQSHDRPYDVDGVYGLLGRAGLELISFAMPGRYNPRALIRDTELRNRVDAFSPQQQAALSERLAGNIKSHIFYAVPQGSAENRVAEIHGTSVPNFVGQKGTQLAKEIWEKGSLLIDLDGLTVQRNLPKDVAGIIPGIDGKRDLNEIAKMLRWDKDKFLTAFNDLYQPLHNFNLLRFSARRGL